MPTSHTRAAYRADLAHIHDVGFGEFSRRAAPGLLALFDRARIREGAVVDLGCGSGIWLRELVRAGYAACGVDRSATMLRLARAAAPQARLVRASVHDVAFPPCAAVTALGEVLSYLPGDAGPAPSLQRLFRRVAQALRPGGLFVFDVLVQGRGAPMAYRTWQGGKDWAVLVDVREDVRRKRVHRDITTFRRVGRGYRRSREQHLLRVVARDEIESALRGAGFTVRVRPGYGAFSVAPRRLVFEARRH